VAAHVFEWSKGDGGHEAYLNNFPPYTPLVGPGLWVPTPPGFLPALQAYWGQNRSCALSAPGSFSCNPGAPLPYSEEEGRDRRRRRLHLLWNTKYRYNLLRPVTYIQNLIDPNWMPILITPPFPEYTSGHSTQSGAAATVLTALFKSGAAATVLTALFKSTTGRRTNGASRRESAWARW
jgi:hypothetical protein